ncbi:hypothetical protein LCGC14_0344540 [marine sediment metagenome]|uniref:Uncharacterized protein n=1 Tax=marine sediment metagenome TaxID=412755 RepID=A0A0F9WKG8_9ZZZZ
MTYKEFIEESDEVLTPVGVLTRVLDDFDLAVECVKALDEYSRLFEYGNNQAPVVVFLSDECAFGCVDLWEEDGGLM